MKLISRLLISSAALLLASGVYAASHQSNEDCPPTKHNDSQFDIYKGHLP